MLAVAVGSLWQCRRRAGGLRAARRRGGTGEGRAEVSGRLRGWWRLGASRWASGVLVGVVAAAAAIVPAGAVRAAPEPCAFTAGFLALHDLLPQRVGECLEGPRYDPESGDAVQQTGGGLLVWHKAANRVTFTDGDWLWLLGPAGLASRAADAPPYPWEDEAAPAPATALDQDAPSLPPSDTPGAVDPGRRPAPDCARARCIALTFDDGPHPQYTPLILNALRASGARATFFVVGSRAQAFPDLVRLEVVDGHELGDHSWSHPNLTRLAATRVQQELRSTQQAVQEVTGTAPLLFRPPYGATNGAVAAGAASVGLPVILWSVDTRDWRDRNAGLVTQRALAGAAPGAIVLLHDMYGSTAVAIPGIVRGLQASGYVLVTVSELLGLGEPGAGAVAGRTFARRP